MHDDSVIYAQVLLLDNKIEGWKICQSMKQSPYDFKAYWKLDRIKDYTMDTNVFNENDVDVPDGWNFNSYVYNVLGVRFINQYEYADDYRGCKAVESTVDEVIKANEDLMKAFGGRFKIIGCLGKN